MKPAVTRISPLTIAKSRARSQSKIKSKKSLLLPFTFLLFTFFSTGIVASAGQDIPEEDVESSTLVNMLDRDNLKDAVTQIEQNWENEYEDYFKTNLSDLSMTAEEIAETLAKLGRLTGKKPALIYMVPSPKQLEIILITPGNSPVHKSIPEANREALLKVVQEFGNEIKDVRKLNTTSYLPTAQQLYKWAIAPIESDLQAQGIDTLLFCVGEGLRTIPLAAFHDGQQFLVEKYSMARIPAFKLTDRLYTNIKNAEVLAMGASEFKDLAPLPAVPLELSTIAPQMWRGASFLNQAFTLVNLRSQRASRNFGIIHFATHAEFQPGDPSNSFIQLWDSKLTLDQMSHMGWNDPPVDLLVLSACRTAIGDKEAELGFAGLAVQSGVKSALASLWYVSDAGTLGLMREFYQDLQTAPIKAEALRQAQIAMLKGKVSLEGGILYGSRGSVRLPPALAMLRKENLSHPFFWAAFTMIGSPW